MKKPSLQRRIAAYWADRTNWIKVVAGVIVAPNLSLALKRATRFPAQANQLPAGRPE